MNRRGFLGRFGLAAGAVAVATTPTRVETANADDFVRGAYRVKWGGWKAPANQSIVFGAWHAKHATRDLEWVSTTMGQCYPSRAWEVFDTSLAKGWPSPTLFLSPEEREALKRRALAALLEAIA